MTHSRLLRWSSLLLLASALPALGANPPKPGAGIHYVYLVRHGTYDRDPDRNADDVVANGLNALGHEQAGLVGARLAALPIKTAALISSNYRRARETADDIGKLLGKAPAIDTLIHECAPASDRFDSMRDHAPGEVAACDSHLARAWADENAAVVLPTS